MTIIRNAVAACLLVLISVAPHAAHAGGRLALVLGNSKYRSVPVLDNPSNDAADLANALRSIGFEVVERRDATRDAMAAAVRDFSGRLRGAEIALFFYAGHGIQMNGENYLLPVDAKIESQADVRFNTINLTDIRQEMEGGGRGSIIILDACRDNPFAEKLAHGGRGAATRGLGRVEASAEGSLIVYSTQPDNVALDGSGRNSPFTAALLKHIETPGLEVRQMISRVRGEVLEATRKRQTPWDSSSLVGDVYLAGALHAPPGAAPPAPAAAEIPPQAPRAAGAPGGECHRLAAPVAALTTPASVANAKPPTDWAHVVEICAAEVNANPGDPRLQDELGRAYSQMKAYPEAVRHYTLAADAGNAQGMSDLGVAFVKGRGVIRNPQKAFELFMRAAVAGNAFAMQNVGSIYADGVVVKRDRSKALEWYEKSIEAGNASALGAAGVQYFNGVDGAPNYKLAAEYFQQAADLGDGYYLKFLALLYENGLLGPVDRQKGAELRVKAIQLDPDSDTPGDIVFNHKKAAAPRRNGGHATYRRAVVRLPLCWPLC